jgi:hypothetical protein
VLISIDGGATWVESAVIKFTAADWDVKRTIQVKAAHDDVMEGERKVMISHSLLVVSTSAADKAMFDEVAIPNVEVRVLDDDLGTLLIRQTDGATRVLEGDALGGIQDTYEVKLAVAPTQTVTVNLDFDSSQIQLFENGVAVTSLTSCPAPIPGGP